MKTNNNKFNVGDVVTFKTHPLFDNFRIKGDGKYVPPIMIIKEVIFENKQKKIFDEETGKEIAEKIKYITIYFDDNKSEFVESHLYEKMLRTFEELKFERINRDGTRIEDYTTLIEEIKNHGLPNYEFGKIVYFRTKKLEVYKKRTSKKIPLKGENVKKVKEILQYVVNYSTPDFVICGFKKESYSDLYYSDGSVKRIASPNFFKVKWFNPFQQKFSEYLLPQEFFTDINPFAKEHKGNQEEVSIQQELLNALENIPES